MTLDMPVRKSDIVIRRSEGLLFDPSNGRLHSLNASAMAIWEACDGETTVDEIAGAITELSRGDPSEIEGQVQQVVADLRHLGLLGV